MYVKRLAVHGDRPRVGRTLHHHVAGAFADEHVVLHPYLNASARACWRQRLGGTTAADRVRHGVRLCLSRPATEPEVARLVQLHATAHAGFKTDPEAAKKMATDPRGPLPAALDNADLAAWTTVANVLLNLDEVVMKR